MKIQSGKLERFILGCTIFLASSSTVQSQTSVLTHHNDIARTGANTTETILTPQNVNQTTFGKLFSDPVDGQVYAQPLYVPGVTMGTGTAQAGTTHNVIFVATEHDSVYAFDADSHTGANANPLWQISLLDLAHGATLGATTVPSDDVGNNALIPEIGITATPVIDPSTHTIYVHAVSRESVGNGCSTSSYCYVHRLHALDVTTGAEKFGGPAVLSASVPGNGNGSSGGTLNFDTKWHLGRAALLLLNGIVYMSFASHNDNGPWHGWILGYSAATLQQTGAWCASPNGFSGGIWLSGGGLAAEVIDPVNHPYGRMFTATGNGTFDAELPPYTNAQDFGDSLIKLDLANGAPTMNSGGNVVGDDFTPYDQATLDIGDTDVASGAVMILPDQTTGGHTHLLFHVSKDAKLRLVDRENMGGYNKGGADNPQIVQELSGLMNGVWSAPAYWNGTIYVSDANSTLFAFPLVNGLLSATNYQSISIGTTSFPGVIPTISANGANNGILWAIRTEFYSIYQPSILYAFDATNIKTKLYSSDQDAVRDTPGLAVKFTVPTVAQGKVYVGTAAEVNVYGLLNGVTQAATPMISPAPQSFHPSIQVTITDSTPAATIYFTTDGNAPSTSSPVYSGPITITSSTTINAMAIASGFLASPVATTTYTLTTQAATPTFNPPPATYTSTQSVGISSTTPGATIYYTTDGSTPTTASTKYAGPVSIDSTETLLAIAVASGFTDSLVASGVYTITPPAPTPIFNPVPGTYTTPQTVTISDATAGATIYYTTNGSAPTTSSTPYTIPFTVSSSATIQAIALAAEFSQSAVGSATYTITPSAATPMFSLPPGTYTSAQTVTISDATAGATIYYTTNGSAPTTSSTIYTGPITVTATETIQAIALATGYTQSTVGSAAYTIITPEFSLSPVSASLTIPPGGLGTDVITIAPQGGVFGNTVQLSCAVTGPVPAPTCTLSSASVTLGSKSLTSTLTIAVPSAAAMIEPSIEPGLTASLHLPWLPFAAMGLVFLGGLIKESGKYVLLCCLFLLFLTQTGCSSVSTGGNHSLKIYTVTVTGVSPAIAPPAIQHSTQISVAVP
jgi:hypothetical protein